MDEDADDVSTEMAQQQEDSMTSPSEGGGAADSGITSNLSIIIRAYQ